MIKTFLAASAIRLETAALLRGTPLFAETTDDESLAACLAGAEELTFAEGENVIEQDQPADGFYLLLEGETRVLKRYPGEQSVLLAVHTEPGSFFGEVPLLLDMPFIATARASRPSRYLRLPVAGFWNMLRGCPSTANVILRTMAGRVKNMEGFTQQRERLIALGTMAAGLAHELNNPAAAARRAVGNLEEAIATHHARSLRVACRPAGPAAVGDAEAASARLTDLEADALARADEAAKGSVDALENSDREDAVSAWLDAHGIPNGWEFASTFSAAGLDPAWLDAFADAAPAPGALADAVPWLESSLTVRALLREAAHSTGRITELVRAVKSYTYLDRGPEQEVDIHEGIESTLTMLGHKLKGVTVHRKFDRSLPRLRAHGSELNQVWTNLLDNAADALPPIGGRITVRTAREDEGHLTVELADNGPGIPPEVRPHLFEPFFTTKAVGQGTGLGLVISYRIVADRHGGEIELLDPPDGETGARFLVRLPLR